MNTENSTTNQQSNKTAWTEERLRGVFTDYNRKYWRGRLPVYRLVVATMPSSMGRCEWTRKVITIAVEQHKSDREVRSTLLHEMAHAAASLRGSRGHDLKFFAQLEKLLHLRAPIAIDTPEAGGVRIFANVVPSRFPLLKRKIDRAEIRRSRPIERFIAEHKLSPRVITEGYVLNQFEDAALELTWKKAVLVVGLEHGMVDETGRPLTRWSRRVLHKAKSRYDRARRNFLQERKLIRDFENRYGNDTNNESATPLAHAPQPMK
jgi:SprT-like family protein